MSGMLAAMALVIGVTAASEGTALSPHHWFARAHIAALVHAERSALHSSLADLVEDAAATMADHGGSRDPPRPRIPWAYTAQITQNQTLNGVPISMGFFSGTTTMSTERLAKRMATMTHSKNPMAPQQFVGTPLEWENVTQFMTAEGLGLEINGEKLDGSAYGAKYYDLFGWLPAAKYAGQVTRNGTSLDAWRLSVPTGHVNLSLLVTADGTPAFFEEQAVMTQPSGNGTYETTISFLTWLPGQRPADIWQSFNWTEFEHPPPCDASSPPEPSTRDMYLFHPKGNFDIAGQDLGDVSGDTTFVCVDVATNRSSGMDHHYEWISHWEVELIPRWGQYQVRLGGTATATPTSFEIAARDPPAPASQACNGYPPMCIGAETFWVGHEAAIALGMPSGGQCSTNPLVGEWYSLPPGGKCDAGQAPDGKACTWRATRVKTIDGGCLIRDRGFAKLCAADGRAPWNSARKAFAAAFESNDPAQGGCPALPVI